jgi:hypothetical protein
MKRRRTKTTFTERNCQILHSGPLGRLANNWTLNGKSSLGFGLIIYSVIVRVVYQN